VNSEKGYYKAIIEKCGYCCNDARYTRGRKSGASLWWWWMLAVNWFSMKLEAP